jgi:hypothetical protein
MRLMPDGSHSPIWPEVTERSSGTHKPEVQREVTVISNENRELRFASRRVNIVPLST